MLLRLAFGGTERKELLAQHELGGTWGPGGNWRGKLSTSMSQVPPGHPEKGGHSSVGRQEALTWPQSLPEGTIITP